MNKRQNKVRKFFNQAAEKYNKDRTCRGGRLFNEFIEIPCTLSLIGEPKKKVSILDIGCGIGSYSYYFGELGYDVTGLDISENMVEISKSKCKPFENVSIINSSFINYEIEKKYDIIIGGFMLGYFENLESTFKKIDKSLNKGGVAVLSMLHPVRLSSIKRTLFSYEIGNYFDEKYYKTDLNMDFGDLELRKWNIEDIFLNIENTNIYVDQIREPVPIKSPKRKFKTQDILFYQKNPSVMVFKFKKK
jgi:2-polyprenyl-3-methyl-5-hydroxy-6-metoxy-1,4-benzoquinol methylase